MQACLGGPSRQSEVCHPPLRKAPVATLFLKDPVAPLPPTFLALLAGLRPLALRTGLWPLALLAGLWPLVPRTGLRPLAWSRTAGSLHHPGRWASPPLLWVQGAQPLLEPQLASPGQGGRGSQTWGLQHPPGLPAPLFGPAQPFGNPLRCSGPAVLSSLQRLTVPVPYRRHLGLYSCYQGNRGTQSPQLPWSHDPAWAGSPSLPRR